MSKKAPLRVSCTLVCQATCGTPNCSQSKIITYLSKLPTSEFAPMLQICHVLLRAAKTLTEEAVKSKRTREDSPRKSVQSSLRYSCLPFLLSPLTLTLLDQRGRKRSEECSRGRGEGKRDTVNEREREWECVVQNRTEQARSGIWDAHR